MIQSMPLACGLQVHCWAWAPFSVLEFSISRHILLFRLMNDVELALLAVGVSTTSDPAATAMAAALPVNFTAGLSNKNTTTVVTLPFAREQQTLHCREAPPCTVVAPRHPLSTSAKP
ncbi:hypothetical protein AB0F18_24335 [Streptomyces sp. NPDC029216]|uniref:hypothetical protein n=1 Tax=Streptomyces sp. NPDC029216 TaxID=3154701 RepID=UPI003407874A